MNYIDIPKEYRIHKELNPQKYLSPEIVDYVATLTWEGNIKTAISGVEKSMTDTLRYEEIQLFHCVVNDRNNIYDVGKRIYKDIKYPCIIEFQIGDATTIGVCEFDAGKIQREKNILHRLCFSHWLHEDILSPEAQAMIETINAAIRKTTDMSDIYTAVRHAILYWKMGGITKAHVDRLICALIGKGRVSPDTVRKYCVPFKYYAVLPGGKQYSTHRRSSTYILIHDYEEIWYCFMKCPETRTVIEHRRYRDLTDLLYSIDREG